MGHVPRVFIGGRIAPGPLSLSGDLAHRLAGVLRLRLGDEFLLFSGDGREWRAAVSAIAHDRIHADVRELVRQEATLPIVLETWCPLIRPNRFDWAIEKCTEAGADVIRPLLAAHSARGEGSSGERQERWARIAVEAAEQCGRLHIPAIQAPEAFDQLLARFRGALLLADPGGKRWQDMIPFLPDHGTIAVAIGPEGGFRPDEVARAKARGALAVSFGPNILRAETAAVVGTALVRALGR